ncbi:MAG: hypothetical protein FH761_12120 [Firmicutes bacterium]|nr:hypothetical protein [Bacillota bacterium]
MRRFKILLTLLIFIAIVFSSRLSVQAFSYQDKFNDIELSNIEELLSERMHIMNEGLFNQMDIDTVEEKLTGIERGKLLLEDINIIKKSRELPTDYSYPFGMKIKSVESVKYEETNVELYLVLEWEIAYKDKQTKEDFLYKIKLLKQKERYYIYNIEVIE